MMRCFIVVRADNRQGDRDVLHLGASLVVDALATKVGYAEVL